MPPPSLSEVRFSSYRAFSGDQKLTVKPLTLVYGYNNTGKSAIVRLLPFLASGFAAQSEDTYEDSYLNYQAESIRGASFSDLAYANKSRMKFGFSWDDDSSLDFSIRKDGSESERLEYLNFYRNREQGSCKFVESLSHESSHFHLDEDENIELSICDYNLSKCKSDSFPVDSYSSNLRGLAESVRWLSSIRVHPLREFEIGAGVPVGIRSNGERTAETLWHLAELKSPSFDLVNKWLISTCGRRIDIDGLESNTISAGRRLVRLDTVPESSELKGIGNIRVPILDLGEGIAQALPVVTLISMAVNGELGARPVICVEQPELHLHPKAIVSLAEFIVSCVSKTPKMRLILETHSESLLIALQIALVEKKLSNKDIAIHWVNDHDTDEEGSSVEMIDIDEDGFLSDKWPLQVFDEVLAQQKSLITKRRR
jgi:predicted ATPase